MSAPAPLGEVDVVVVGAGIVGLATAAALARDGRSVCVLEREPGIARGITSRNSEVIHAGIYYPPASLKARFCVAGNAALYTRCAARKIPHRRAGKLIVATSDAELPALERLQATGLANGARGLTLIDAPELRRREPEVRAVAALRSPNTGIVDAHALARSFGDEAEALGAVILAGREATDLESSAFGWRVTARSTVRPTLSTCETIACGAVVNAAGLDADRVAALAGLDVAALGYRLHPCKGDYFALAPGRRLALTGLVYPLPAGPSLGIHATPDLAGRLRFGPDAEYVRAPSYTVAPAKAAGFAAAVGRFLPAVEADWLVPDFAGVRPKLAGPGEPFRDFVVREETDAGAPALVNCLGIESPGLTAAPAIAARVTELLAGL